MENMRLRRLQVANFGCVNAAEIEFGPGLNVLYGPNDLGKSTLAAALRCGLLLQYSSSAAKRYVPWGSTSKPEVTIDFELDKRIWRVQKIFGSGTGSGATLAWSNDGSDFTQSEQGRGVDGELRRLLGWGLAQPGGRGGKSGLPKSFLSTVLLGEQALPYNVFGTSLADDAEDDGKARLSAALEAMATDPLYQVVLGHVQGRVDEAFTAKGQPSLAKDSPFRRIQDEIKGRREACGHYDQQVADSEAVVVRLGELSGERDRRMAELTAKREQHDSMATDHGRARQRADLERQGSAAAKVVADIDLNRDEVTRLGAQRVQRVAELPRLERSAEQTLSEHNKADKALSKAQAVCDEVATGEDTQLLQQAESLRQRRVAAEAHMAAVQDQRTKLQTWSARQAEQVQAEAEQVQAGVAHTEAEVELRTRTQAHREAVAHQTEQALGLCWVQRESRREQLEQLEAGHAQGLERGEHARAQASRAQETLATLHARAVPNLAERQRLRGLYDDLRVSQAQLGGGFVVQLALESGHAPRVIVDEAASQQVAGTHELQAMRELQLDLDGVGRIQVRAGESTARAAAKLAAERWHREGESVLHTLQQPDLDSLDTLAHSHGEAMVRAQKELDEAGALERLAATQLADADALAASKSKLAEFDQQLATVDTDVLAQRTDGRSEREQRATSEAATRAAQQARDRCEASKAEHARQVGNVAVAAERMAATKRARTQAAQQVDGDPAELGAQTQDTVAELELKLAGIASDELAFEGKRAARQEQAKASLVRAQATQQATQTADRLAHEALQQCRDAVVAIDAALRIRSDQARAADPETARETLAALRDTLQAIPQPGQAVSDELLAATDEARNRTEQALADAEAEVRKAEGALSQVGGQVVRDKAEGARDALDATLRREAELEIDYQGSKLLLESLRAAENEEGQHLGRALAPEIEAAFERLTHKRYGALRLGPELQAQGVETAGGLKDIAVLSEGVKEQLATILRVRVANHLHGALVLDDHLAQSDPERARWFRDLLLSAANDIQVLLLTCRPDDYLGDVPSDGGESGSSAVSIGSIRAIDLAQLIDRGSVSRPPK